MDVVIKGLTKVFDSWSAAIFVIAFGIASYFVGKARGDMNLFSAAGGVMTIFGLLSMVRFATMEKYLQRASIVARSSGLTGPPLSEEEAIRIARESRAAADKKIKAELRSELRGLALTIVGTVIWAYGVYA